MSGYPSHIPYEHRERIAKVLRAGVHERERQDQLKASGKFKYTCADKEIGHMECLAILLEEVGEAAQALEHQAEDPAYRSLISLAIMVGEKARRTLNAKRLANDPDEGKSHKPDRDLETELIQSFAVLMAWLEGYSEKSV